MKHNGFPRSPIIDAHMDKHGAGSLERNAEAKTPTDLFNINVPLAMAAVKRYRGAPAEADDIVQQALMGLWHAANKYDRTMGVPFPSYAKWWCRAFAGGYAARYSCAVSVPKAAFAAYHQRRRGDDGALARRHSGEALDAVGAALAGSSSLDAEIGRRGLYREGGWRDLFLKDTLVSESPMPDSGAVESSTAWAVGDAIGRLGARHAEIICRCFGVCGREQEDMASIGRSMGISKERVRQLKEEAVSAIRQNVGGRFSVLFELMDVEPRRVRPTKGAMRAVRK